MKSASSAFKGLIKSGGPFYAYVTAVLADGTALTFNAEKDFMQQDNAYSESGGDGFPLGAAVCKQITLNIDNHDDRFSEYDFLGAKFTAYTEADLPSGNTERLLEGIFTVIDSVAPGDILEISAYDNMYKLDADFKSNLEYPVTLRQLWNELCDYFDLMSGSTTFANDSFVVSEKPEGFTGRELAGYIAQIAGGNAVVDANGRLCIKTYNFSVLDTMSTISGGTHGETVNNSISAGQFGDGLANSISAGQFGDSVGYHVLSDFTTDPEIGTDDVIVTGIATTIKTDEGTDTTLIYGTNDYALSISNPLIAGQESTVLNALGDILIGVTIRPFSGEFSPNPLIEFMDIVCVIDKKDNIHFSFVTEHNFAYLGMSSVTNGLESPEKNKANYSSTTTKMLRETKKEIADQKTEMETAVENLQNQLANSSGMYKTEDVQPDGSIIYYLHNKPQLEESETVVKITAQALGISTDGGQTYPYGMDVSGTAILDRIYTIGLNADYINSGSIIARDTDGNIVFSVNVETGQITMDASVITMQSENLETYINGVKQTAEKAIQGSVEEFYSSTSSKALLGGTWSTTSPEWEEGRYIWRRTKVTYGDGSIDYTPSQAGVCITGNTGEQGETGNGIKTTVVAYQASASGTTIPTGTWSSSIPTVSAGSYLWTRTVITYTDNTTTTSYSVGKMGSTGPTGPTGEDGKGIKKTDITYQAGSSQTSAPTGSWSSSVPALTTSLPYLWTRTIITYTDNTTSTSYSVSSTLDSIEVGGRNLALYTNQGTSHWVWTMQVGDYTATEVDVNGVRACKLTRGNTEYSGWSVIYYDEISPTKYEPSTDYTVSFDVLPSVSTAFRVRLMETDGTDELATRKISKALSANTWNRVSVKITTLATLPESRKQVLYLNAMNSDPGVSYTLKNLKIEKGNKATDWTPAPEDTEKELEEVHKEIVKTYTDLTKTANEIILEAVKEYVKTTDLETFKQQISTQFVQTAESVDIIFERLTEQLTALEGDTTSEFTNWKKYIRFIDGSIVLGVEGNPLILTLVNDRISFTNNGVEVAYFSNNRMYVNNITILASADLCGLKVVKGNNGDIFIG